MLAIGFSVSGRGDRAHRVTHGPVKAGGAGGAGICTILQTPSTTRRASRSVAVGRPGSKRKVSVVAGLSSGSGCASEERQTSVCDGVGMLLSERLTVWPGKMGGAKLESFN